MEAIMTGPYTCMCFISCGTVPHQRSQSRSRQCRRRSIYRCGGVSRITTGIMFNDERKWAGAGTKQTPSPTFTDRVSEPYGLNDKDQAASGSCLWVLPLLPLVLLTFGHLFPFHKPDKLTHFQLLLHAHTRCCSADLISRSTDSFCLAAYFTAALSR